MAPLDIDTALDWRGRTVVDRDGEKIGTLREIYLDEQDRPSWASVHTGLFGLRETFVPLRDVEPVDDSLRVAYPREQVEQAPSIEPDVQLSDDEEDRLYQHYGAARAEAAAGEARSEAAAGAARSEAPAGDDDAMTRSEEEVLVGKRKRVRGKAKLKKYVVTDYVEKKVPVQREEVRVEYEPADTPHRGD